MSNILERPKEERITDWKKIWAAFKNGEVEELPSIHLRIGANERIEIPGKVLAAGTPRERWFWEQLTTAMDFRGYEYEVEYQNRIIEWVAAGCPGEQPRMTIQYRSTKDTGMRHTTPSTQVQNQTPPLTGHRHAREEGTDNVARNEAVAEGEWLRRREAEPVRMYTGEPKLHNAPTFSGEPGEDIEYWIRQITVMMMPYRGWTEDMKLAAVAPLLEGGAREFYVNWQYDHLDDPIDSWEELAAALRHQYGNRFELQRLWQQFETLRCPRGGEEQYLAGCQRLFPRLLAHGVGEALLCELFRSKVKNDYIRSRLYETQDLTLQEGYRLLQSGAASQRAAEDRPWRHAPAARQQWRQPQQQQQVPWRQQQQPVMQQNYVQPRRQQQAAPDAPWRNRYRGPGRVDQEGRPVCNRCGRRGHFVRDCREGNEWRRPREQYRLMANEEAARDAPPPQQQQQQQPREEREIGDALAEEVAGLNLNQ